MARRIKVATGSGRLDHPSGVFRLERETMGKDAHDRRGDSSRTYQSLMAEESEVDGKPGLLIDIDTMHTEARYYLTMKEAKLLSEFLTARTKGAEPEIWDEPKSNQKKPRKRRGPTNG